MKINTNNLYSKSRKPLVCCGFKGQFTEHIAGFLPMGKKIIVILILTRQKGGYWLFLVLSAN